MDMKMKVRCDAVRAMELLARAVNNEDFFEEWLKQTRNFTPLYSVDVSEVMTNKVEMLRLYKGQNPGDMLVKMTLERARLRGSQRTPQCKYAEVFTSYDGKPVPGGVLEKLKETVILNEAQSKKQ